MTGCETCRANEVDAAAKHAAMVARIRAIAVELEWVNALYDYDITRGQWSPHSLRYEADYLERNP
jgi:hypothetical protein